MGFTVRQVSQMYGVPVIDYGRNEGDWLLLSAGTGLMMAVMDAEPRFRYTLDTDLCKGRSAENLGEWLVCMEQLVARICAVGWFSRPENGEPMARWLTSLTKRPLVYFGVCEKPHMYDHCDRSKNLREFLNNLHKVT